MQRRFVTVDVFTDRLFGGNPVAIVLDADGLDAASMQAVASEFNLSETVFVLPPRDAAHAARLRIFTPRSELPFAGHPNVGAGFALARAMAARGEAVPDRLVFEEEAGDVAVRPLRVDGAVRGADLTAPGRLERLGTVGRDEAAALLTLEPADIAVAAHAPEIVSVGLPFLVVALASRDALRRARPHLASIAKSLPAEIAEGVFLYANETGGNETEQGTDVQARMFAPLDGIVEDPATGSAAAAFVAFRADLGGGTALSLRIGQGVDMGRPSLLQARAERVADGMIAHVGGRCVAAMSGVLDC